MKQMKFFLVALMAVVMGVSVTCLNKKDIFPIIESDDYFKEGIINGPEDWQLERETNY